MTSIKNVAVAGASGNLGPAIVKALLESGKYNVTVFARSPSAVFPEAVKVVTVDYTSIENLTTALNGQDAVVSTLASGSHESEKNLVRASAAAGVKRFIPSEFGCDIANENTLKLPVFRLKAEVGALLKEMSTRSSTFTYTAVRNNAFLDWGIAKKFLIDLDSATPTFFDGGDRVFSASNVDSIAKAVFGILENLEETKNRAVYIQDAAITQRKLLTIAQKLAPERKWEPINVSTVDLVAKADEQLAKGSVSSEARVYYIIRAMFGEGYGGEFKKLDNELLGLKGKTDADLEDIIRPILTKN